MNDLDRKIKEALAAEDAALFDQLDSEQSLFDMVGESFRGKRRGLVVLVYGSILVFTGLSIAAAIQFAWAEEVRGMILWASAFVFFMLSVLGLKIWYWMELNRNSVTREIKRVELQIAELSR